ncbi:MAG TPA: cytochrome c biogenesis protein CcsA [Anaerolineae bacterium]|nr:cytochrome c biogenesis protein CcsA [Anaerolineae bacterium]
MSSTRLNQLIRIFNWSAAIIFLITTLMIFFYAPTERTMGNVQRILYFHVGSAWVASIAFAMGLLGGVLYLRSPSRRWDNFSLASVEIGLVFVTMTIASGSVWGRPAWNTWWIWSSPRLTSIVILWLTYVAYFMLRGALADEERRGRLSAIYVIASFATVVFCYLSIRLLRDIHPVVFGDTLVESAQGASQGESEFANGLDSMRMGITMTMSTISFTLLYIAWVLNRIRLQNMIYATEKLKARLSARLQGGH